MRIRLSPTNGRANERKHDHNHDCRADNSSIRAPHDHWADSHFPSNHYWNRCNFFARNFFAINHYSFFASSDPVFFHSKAQFLDNQRKHSYISTALNRKYSKHLHSDLSSIDDVFVSDDDNISIHDNRSSVHRQQRRHAPFL